MKAAVMRDGAFYVEDLPTPVPGPGQVLVKTRACGICGSDLHLFKHAKQIVETARGMGAAVDDLSRDLVLGHEFVGEIVAFGSDTQGALKPGDRVCSVPFLLDGQEILPIGASKKTSGAYAEFLLLSEAMLLKVNDDVPDAAAALTEPIAIGVHALNKARLQGDEASIVIGCGPIGLAIIALLKARGAKTIIASDPSTKRREIAQRLGASSVVDPTSESPFTTLAGQAPGKPVVVYECAGVTGLLAGIVLEAPKDTRIIVAGICPGEDKLMPMVAITKELCIQYVSYYTPNEFAEALDLLSRGALDWEPMITGRVGLDGVSGAFAALMNPAESHAKILIEP
jgi:threonine dehydrogenase-like Zn-dependent dehydrogenase